MVRAEQGLLLLLLLALAPKGSSSAGLETAQGTGMESPNWEPRDFGNNGRAVAADPYNRLLRTAPHQNNVGWGQQRPPKLQKKRNTAVISIKALLLTFFVFSQLESFILVPRIKELQREARLKGDPPLTDLDAFSRLVVKSSPMRWLSIFLYIGFWSIILSFAPTSIGAALRRLRPLLQRAIKFAAERARQALEGAGAEEATEDITGYDPETAPEYLEGDGDEEAPGNAE